MTPINMTKILLFLGMGGIPGIQGRLSRLRSNLYAVEEKTSYEQENNMINSFDSFFQEDEIMSRFLLGSMSMSMSTPLDGDVWRFTVSAGIHEPTSEEFGGFDAAKELVQDQFQIINSRFDTAFDKPIVFELVNVYEFSGPVIGFDGEVFRSHPEADFLVVYDGFPTFPMQSGGWYSGPQSIHHLWPVASDGGPFDSTATDGLIHEFGHSRECIDIYALTVEADKNPVNGEPYNPEESIMNIPYGVTVWDQHSINVVNSNSDLVPANLDYVQETWPTFIDFIALDSSGQGLDNVRIQLFRVPWYSSSVDPTREAGLRIETNASGKARWSMLDINLFGPECFDCPWYIETPNFLVEFEAPPYNDESLRLYEWLPLNDVQKAQPAQEFKVVVQY